MALLAPVLGGGGIFGNLALAALSFGSSLALAYFFPQKIRGPRAESLKAQTSRYGDHIARSYGTTRLAGGCFWLKNNQVDEHQHTTGPGSLGPEVTEFSYTADFAIAFTWNGPVEAIPRIWADDKLIYDMSNESLEFESEGAAPGGGGVVQGADVTIYLGTDDQMPDPHIEADRGVGQVSAYRGICYAVIRNLPLDEFGIRVPNIEAEVVRRAVFSTPSFEPTPEVGDASPWHVDINGQFIAAAGGPTDEFGIFQLPGQQPIFYANEFVNPNQVHITDRGEVMVSVQNETRVDFYDANSGAFIESVAGINGTLGENAVADDVTVNGITYLLLWRWSGWLSCIENAGLGNVLLWSTSTVDEPLSDVMTLSASPTRIYGCIGNSKQVAVIEWTISALVPITSQTRVTLSELGGDVVVCHYDEESDSVIVVDEDGSIFVYEPDLSSVLRSRSAPSGFNRSANADPLASKRLKIGSDRIALKGDNNSVYEFRVSTLEHIRTVDGATSGWVNESLSGYSYSGFSESMQALITVGNAGTRPLVVWYLPRAGRAGEPLADVIAAECELAGIAYDVSEITGDVLGYGVRDGAPPRAVLEDLAKVKFFDSAHVDGVTKFFPRQTTAVRTLALADMGMSRGDGGPVIIREEYPDAAELVTGAVLRYLAWDATYRTSAQAVANPLGVEDTLGTLEIETSLVMTDEEAAQAVDIIFNETRDAPKVYRTSVGPKQLDLHPGNVVTLPLDQDRSVKGVLVKQAGESVLEMEFRHRGSSFTSEAIPVPTPDVPQSNLTDRAQSVFLPIDGHLLRAADDNDRFYAGVYKRQRGKLISSTVYRSTDSGETYRPWATFARGTVRGLATEALPDRPHPWAWDRASSFAVSVPFGAFPESVTEDELLADETLNAFAVRSGTEWEYIRAANVVDNGDGTYTLSTLLRGRRGTEFAMAGHAAGDMVVYLDEENLQRPSDGDRTLTRIYVAVSTGTTFNATTAVTFTNMGKGLRPWAPVNLRATRDGSDNITGTFNRRDRLGQAWPDDGPENPPMSEDTESYSVRIYDTDGETILRTIAASSETWAYSAANQTTDFGAPVAEGDLDVGIVQNSATFGTGIEARAFL